MSIPLFTDTSPDAERVLVEGYRRMAPGAKLLRVRELTQGVQQMALARLRCEHPNAGETELRLHLASLWLDPQTMKQAFGWEPPEGDK
ncbi:MAG: hypothetical protein ABIO70_33110 [Pseudomonadota bacterium]